MNIIAKGSGRLPLLNWYHEFVKTSFADFNELKAAYVIWFGTHKEYDKIDAEAVPFDGHIKK